jgi:putative serine/threonine phosphatase, family 2C protein
VRLEYYSDRGGYNGTSRVRGYREHNEDTIGCFQLDLKDSSELPIYVLVVCDGMGGGVRGKYASSLTVQAIKSIVGSITLSASDEDLNWLSLVQKEVSKGIRKAHMRLCAEYENKSTCATTCSVAIVQGSHYCTIQIGDTRVYELSSKGLDLKTEDDSWAFNKLKSGEMTEAEIRVHKNRHMITKAVGVYRGFRLQESEVHTLKIGSGILVTSDGFSELLTEQKAKLIWSKENQLESMSKMMVGEGQKDNISAIFYMPTIS